MMLTVISISAPAIGKIAFMLSIIANPVEAAVTKGSSN